MSTYDSIYIIAAVVILKFSDGQSLQTGRFIVRNNAINLGGMSFLLADANPYTLSTTHSILRGFGAGKVTEARDAHTALEVMVEHRPDILLCDGKLPPAGGISLIKFVRGRAANPFRTLPILAMTSDIRVSNIKQIRDSGANMVIAKPMSPATLHDRLIWVLFNPRKFVDELSYSGPDRRVGIEEPPEGTPDRRKDGGGMEPPTLEDAHEPALSQNEIDNLFNTARG